MKKTPVLIADQQALAVAGIKHILENSEQFQVVGETADADELQFLIERTSAEVLVFDYAHLRNFSPSDFLVLTNDFPFLRLMIITADDNPSDILNVLQVKVLGFLTKGCSAEEIYNAFQAIQNGQKFYCERVLDVLMESQVRKKEEADTELLSDREIQIVRFISLGLSTPQMAEKLHLSPHTVNAHRKTILKKLKVNTPVELVVKAFRLGMIPVS